MPEEYLSLKDHIRDVETHYLEGLQRIKDYYDGHKENPPLIDAPHEILEKIAAQFFREAMDSCLMKNDIDLIRYQDSSLYGVCVGCGTEILMKAIILLKKPEKLTENFDMGYESAKHVMLNEILGTMEYKKRERISDVLKMIQTKRNQLVHLSMLKFDAYYEDYQIFSILEYLYSKYFPNSEVLNDIKEHKEMYKVQSGMDLEPVEFD